MPVGATPRGQRRPERMKERVRRFDASAPAQIGGFFHVFDRSRGFNRTSSPGDLFSPAASNANCDYSPDPFLFWRGFLALKRWGAYLFFLYSALTYLANLLMFGEARVGNSWMGLVLVGGISLLYWKQLS